MPYHGICTNCGKPCQVITCDYGIGAYEYWGAPGNDIDIHIVSACCDAPAIEDNGDVITAKDLYEYNMPDNHL